MTVPYFTNLKENESLRLLNQLFSIKEEFTNILRKPKLKLLERSKGRLVTEPKIGVPMKGGTLGYSDYVIIQKLKKLWIWFGERSFDQID
jgi:hypothetical protein